jgi:hypothetical protein
VSKSIYLPRGWTAWKIIHTNMMAGKRLAYLELRMMVALLVWKFEFKEVREELTSDEADEAITTTPKYCYVALQSVS